MKRNRRKSCPSGMVFLQILQTLRFANGLQGVHHPLHAGLLARNARNAAQFQNHSCPSEGNGNGIVSFTKCRQYDTTYDRILNCLSFAGNPIYLTVS